MTSPVPSPSPVPENAATAPPKGAAVGQFRLHKDANLGIPLAKVTKTTFVQQAVFAALKEPARLGLAMSARAVRGPVDLVQRVSITITPAFNQAVEELSVLMRISGEEVVRLAVEYAVFVENQA